MAAVKFVDDCSDGAPCCSGIVVSCYWMSAAFLMQSTTLGNLRPDLHSWYCKQYGCTFLSIPFCTFWIPSCCCPAVKWKATFRGLQVLVACQLVLSSISSNELSDWLFQPFNECSCSTVFVGHVLRSYWFHAECMCELSCSLNGRLLQILDVYVSLSNVCHGAVRCQQVFDNFAGDVRLPSPYVLFKRDGHVRAWRAASVVSIIKMLETASQRIHESLGVPGQLRGRENAGYASKAETDEHEQPQLYLKTWAIFTIWVAKFSWYRWEQLDKRYLQYPGAVWEHTSTS